MSHDAPVDISQSCRLENRAADDASTNLFSFNRWTGQPVPLYLSGLYLCEHETVKPILAVGRCDIADVL